MPHESHMHIEPMTSAAPYHTMPLESRWHQLRLARDDGTGGWWCTDGGTGGGGVQMVVVTPMEYGDGPPTMEHGRPA